MDMQNVSNLTIPEGEVRTIHDKDKRLLWGAVGYDTKYAGDTLQDGTPTPDAPIPVQVAAGGQTVTVGDGVGFKVSPISLGSLELCKIGNYQDYIYKSGDDWCVHKETSSVIYGASDITAANSYSNIVYARSPKPIDSDAYHTYGQKEMFCTHATATNTTGTWNSTQNIGKILSGASLNDYWYGFAAGTTLEQIQTALNGCEVYYVLATPTDTKITDSALISQLNAVHQWLVRYGYNATVTGNLPIIIDRTNL